MRINVGAKLGQQFEELVFDICKYHGFKLDNQHQLNGGHDNGIDLTGELHAQSHAFSVIFYRSSIVQPSLIQNAITVLISGPRSITFDKLVLVVSCKAPTAVLNLPPNAEVWDQTRLYDLAAVDLQLTERLTSLLGMMDSSIQTTSNATIERKSPIHKREYLKLEIRGKQLCKQLQSIKPGKAQWRAYEDCVLECLKYLFDKHLMGWHMQKLVQDGLQRYDIVCRISSHADFWEFVLTHIESRYIVFEAKNYSGKLKQSQILTTEKYLFPKGLRRMAIVICRNGAEKNSVKVIQGAMREHGLLIIVISDDQLCEMLLGMDKGKDPSDYLFSLTDEFLLTLSR